MRSFRATRSWRAACSPPTTRSTTCAPPVYHELVSFMEKDPQNIAPALDLLAITRNLERIADHSTNIAEDVLFLVKGVDVRHHAEARMH